MNVGGSNLYGLTDQSYMTGTKENTFLSLNNHLIATNNFDPQYIPVFDPYMTQTINQPLYPIHSMNMIPNGNNSISYSYPYSGMHNFPCMKDFDYNNHVRPFIPQINYQSNQITVVPNIQINTTDSATYSANNFIEITHNSSDTMTTYQDNRVLSSKGQDNYKRTFKSQRQKIRSIVPKICPKESLPTSDPYLSNSSFSEDISESSSINNQSVIEVLVTNLDYNIGAKEWKKLLYNQFQSALKRIHSVYIQTQTDGTNCALVRVNSIEDARLAISQFHRKKIGYKRIQVNLVNSNLNIVSGYMKQEVASLLKSVAGYSLSVFKFMELYEKRYHRNISISDFYKMKDFVEIKDVGGTQNGKIISLTNTAINYIDQTMESTEIENFESSICTLHCKEGTEDYLTTLESTNLPNVEIKLKLLKEQVHKMLQSHNGDLPLMSFMSCYKVDFDDLKIIKHQNSIENIESENQHLNDDFHSSINGAINKVKEITSNLEGIPLEHLISCIGGIRITTAVIEVRKIQWEDKTDIITTSSNGLGGILVDRLHQFSREVVDLIKHQPGCKILLSKFIPTYHHHFGKQCRVADYGFSKLHELIDALPQVVHVIGFGYMRMLYLSHKVQVRRFTNELMKVLKSQSTKSCILTEYPLLYRSLFHKEFNVNDYGICFLDDLLDEIPDNTIEITTEDFEVHISMPKRIQTQEEKERTTQFATEVIDLLKESPRCKLPFNKFIPSYHHHFSRQCKVAEYGFTKLIELLEAIPLVVQIIEEHGEKYVFLTQHEMLRVFGEQTLNILEKSYDKRIQLSEFSNVYFKTQGYPLNLEDFSMIDITQLISRIPKVAKLQRFSNKLNISSELQFEEKTLDDPAIENCNEQSIIENIELFVCLADRNHVTYLAHKVLLILLDVINGSLMDYQFLEKYRQKYREEPDILTIQNELYDIVEVTYDSSLVSCQRTNGFNISLKPLILFARDLKELIKFNQGKMPLVQLELNYEQQFGTPLNTQSFGYSSLLSLVQACDFVVNLKGRGVRATMILNHDFVNKLAYRVAYSTEPALINTIDCNEESSQIQNVLLKSTDVDQFEQHLSNSFIKENNTIITPQISPKTGYIAPMMYNHYINPQTNFVPPMSTFPYFNTQMMYNTWYRQWFQPHTSYGYSPNIYPSEYTVLPLNQAASIPQNTLPQTYNSYIPTASQDQIQIDELVETLAYDNSGSSTMTPPPSSIHYMQPTHFDGNNTLIPNPWLAYPVQSMMSPNVFHNVYPPMISSSTSEDRVQSSDPTLKIVIQEQEKSVVNVTENIQCTNNNSFSKEFTKCDKYSEQVSFSSNSYFHSTWTFSKTIS